MLSRRLPLASLLTLLLSTSLPAQQSPALFKDGSHLTHLGQPFTPYGFNYDRDHKMRLIEEYWHTDWPTVVEDFKEMKSLGANTIRIHLQLHEFLTTPDQPNEKNLAKLKDLLELAQDSKLLLDLTGLACYRKEKTPEWYSHADEKERWRIQSNFWRAIATACKSSPAVAWYNLINEPLIPNEKRAPGDFLVGHLADFWYCQFITLDPANRPRDQVARAWIRTLRTAIREVDKEHLITVGILPNSTSLAPDQSGFLPSTVAPDLDFLCLHIYPRKAPDMDKDLDTLATFAATGKPVVIEEIFPLACSADELRTFLTRARPCASGILGFYWGQTPADLKANPSILNAITAEWLSLFSEGWKPAPPAVRR